MALFRFLLEMYFAAILGTAGFAKLDHSRLFLSNLQRLNLLPDWTTVTISRVFPWFEILLACLLLLPTQTYKFIVALIVFALFICFFIFNAVVNIRKMPSKDCGCYGRAVRLQGHQTERVALCIQLILAALLVSFSLWVAPLPASYYLGSTALFVGISGWLGWKIWQRHHYFAKVNQLTGIVDHQG